MLTPGTRTDFRNLRVTRISCYERKERDGTEQTKWRYAFVDDAGDRYVYTGRHYRLEVSEYVAIRATIKRIEPIYNSIRLARIKILSRGYERTLL